MTEETQATEAKKPARAPAEVETIKMADGREVAFVGKRKMNKEAVELPGGAVGVRFDLRNGYTRTFAVSTSPLLSQFAVHGASQKIGDEAAGEEDVEDMQVCIDTIINRLEGGEWGKQRGASDGFSGAGIVVRALCEVTGKSVDDIKAYLEKKLASTAGLTRRDLYASFKNPNSPTGQAILRMENEKRAKAAKVDVQAELDGLMGA